MPAIIALPTCTETYFGYISVVMIASAASLRLFGFSSLLNAAQSGANFVHGQRPADDAGGKGQDVVGIDAQLFADDTAGLDRVVDALLAHRHVGVLAVDHQRLREAIGDMLAPDNHRRAGKTIARKHRRRARADGGIDDSQIERGVFDADILGEREKSLGMVKFFRL